MARKRKVEERDVYECGVCVEEKSKGRVKCPNCAYDACSACQKRFDQPNVCMNCRYEFCLSFLEQLVSKQFVEKTVRPKLVEKVITAERQKLTKMEPLVAWKKEFELIRSLRRYGSTRPFPERPVLENAAVLARRKIACPKNECRGFLRVTDADELICFVCNGEACSKCHEVLTGKEHICDENVVKTVTELNSSNDHRPCPKCETLIYRISGCNHMHCTTCGIDFHWETRKILRESTNHHYRNLAPRMVEATATAAAPECVVVSLDRPRIPKEILMEKLGDGAVAEEAVLYSLYETADAMRSLKKDKFDENTLHAQEEKVKENIHLDFLMEKITETQWKNSIYRNHNYFRIRNLMAGLMTVYLETIDEWQSELWQAAVITPEFVERLDTFIRMTNESLRSIYYDYGTHSSMSLLQIRERIQPRSEFCELRWVTAASSSASSSDDEHTKKRKSGSENEEEEEEEEEPPQIELEESQVGHVTALRQILCESKFAFDLSPLGAGKTFTSSFLRKELGFRHFVVFAPVSVNSKWQMVSRAFDIDLTDCFSYASLGGQTGVQPNCGFLVRNDYFKEGETEDGELTLIPKIEMHANEKWKKMVSEGVLVVFDECQDLKNESATTKGCRALCRAILSSHAGASRILFMSGSPIDREKQVLTFFRNVGILSSGQLSQYNPAYGTSQWTGMQEIEDYCRALCPCYEFHDARRQVGITNTTDAQQPLLAYAYKLFLEVLLPFRSSSMSVVESDFTIHKANCHHSMTGTAEIIALNEGLQVIQNAIEMMQRPREAGAPPRQSIFASITLGLMRVETAKISLFVKLATEILRRDTREKLVIAVNFTDTTKDLQNLLSEFNPIVITSSDSVKVRGEKNALFQTPSAEHRLLISNTRLISTGIDLDDKDGQFPRTCLVSPSYRTIDLYQLGHRFLRGKYTKSDSNFFLIFSNNENEGRLLNVLTRKGSVMKAVSSKQAAQGVLFPCDFPNRYFS